MIRNYFKIALRNITRHKAYSAINISGLAIGIAACLLLFLVVRYELSYDSFQKNYKRIFHIVMQDKYSDGIDYTGGVPFPALEAARLDFPQVTSGALYANYGSQVTVAGTDPLHASGNKKFVETTGIFFCDPQFFEVFDYKWLVGSPAILKEPNITVLTKSMAEKYFSKWRDAVGQYLKLDNAVTVRVSGILDDPPANTDFPLRVVTSFETMKRNASTYRYMDNWNQVTSNFQVYMMIPENVSVDLINNQLKGFSKKHRGSDGNSERALFLQPLSEVHFDSRFGNLGDHVSSKSTLRTLSLIGLLIIVMACINFVNLSTAQSVGRSKEVGVRKVLGGNRRQLFRQMMGETALIVIMALVLSIAIAWLALPYVKHFVSIPESLNLFNSEGILFILITGLVVTALSGIYPSMILSGFRPALALKNKINAVSTSGITLRRGLVILQFAISQILIIGTIIAVSQMNYVRSADLGFNKNAVLVLNGNSDSTSVARQPAFKDQLLRIPGVQSVSLNTDPPSSDNNWGTNFAFDYRPDEKFTVFLKFSDPEYFTTYGLHLIAGRVFEKSDTIREVVINETLMRKLGVKNPRDILGKSIRLGRNSWKPIVGVVRDFKTNSLREEVKPLLISTSNKNYGSAAIKLNTTDISGVQAAIQATWDKFYPEYANTATFFDESIARFYQQENQLSTLYKIFAGLAIFISCLGLYGLVSFMAIQKTKEVGIRKVLGASAANIVYLFSREFTILISAAFLIAAPVAYYMMNDWLNHFVYRVSIGISVFAAAVVVSILIAWLTVGYKAIRAALANPVLALRRE
jgi:putative ABC transport system permease protein